MEPEETRAFDRHYDGADAELEDVPEAVFNHNGRAFMILFVRKSKPFTSPMAMNLKTGEVHQVVRCDVSGFFRKFVHLILLGKTAEIIPLKIPLTALAAGFEISGPKFLKWIKSVSPLLMEMGLPEYMFTRYVDFKDNKPKAKPIGGHRKAPRLNLTGFLEVDPEVKVDNGEPSAADLLAKIREYQRSKKGTAE